MSEPATLRPSPPVGSLLPDPWAVSDFGADTTAGMATRPIGSRCSSTSRTRPLRARPFVGAFQAFNPTAALALLDTLSAMLGLSATLVALWGLTFALTCLGIDRLARSVWPEMSTRVGVVAIGLLLTARAGNIGTNHLFEPLLLDRLIGFALGWLAFAFVIERPEAGWWKASLAIGAAGLIHPSVGLQLGLILGSGWIGWGLLSVARWRLVGWAVASLGIAVAPGLIMNLGQGGSLLVGLPPEEFRLLSVELQGPQHMLHLWRWPQWLAWGAIRTALCPLRRLRLEFRAKWSGAKVRLAVLPVVLIAPAPGWPWSWSRTYGTLSTVPDGDVGPGLALLALPAGSRSVARSDVLGRCRAALLTVDWWETGSVVATLARS